MVVGTPSTKGWCKNEKEETLISFTGQRGRTDSFTFPLQSCKQRLLEVVHVRVPGRGDPWTLSGDRYPDSRRKVGSFLVSSSPSKKQSEIGDDETHRNPDRSHSWSSGV